MTSFSKPSTAKSGKNGAACWVVVSNGSGMLGNDVECKHNIINLSYHLKKTELKKGTEGHMQCLIDTVDHQVSIPGSRVFLNIS